MHTPIHVLNTMQVDRFVMHVASQLETAPLQLPRPRRLIGKLLVLLGRLPLSDFHPDAPVGLDVVAALVSRFIYV